MSASRQNETTTFAFRSEEGRALVSDTVFSALKYRPHDYQLDGVCNSLDGCDLVAIMATGTGKTAYFTMYMTLLRALSRTHGALRCDGVTAPEHPAMVIVYPTVGLETEMVCIQQARLLAFPKTSVIGEDICSCRPTLPSYQSRHSRKSSYRGEKSMGGCSTRHRYDIALPRDVI